jgi:hypothetical protein
MRRISDALIALPLLALFSLFGVFSTALAAPIVETGPSNSLVSLATFQATALANANNDKDLELFLASPDQGLPGAIVDSSQFQWANLNSLQVSYDPGSNTLTTSVSNTMNSAVLAIANLTADLVVGSSTIEFVNLNTIDISISEQNAVNTRIINLLDLAINGVDVAENKDLISMGSFSQFHISGIDLGQFFTFTALIELSGNFNNSTNNSIDLLFGFEVPVPISGPKGLLLFAFAICGLLGMRWWQKSDISYSMHLALG